MNHYTPTLIKKELDSWVIGNEDAKKTLAILGYNHYLRFYKASQGLDEGPNPPRLTGLVWGSPGSGKTYLIDKLSDYLHFPICHIDCTTLTRPGFQGTDIISYLQTYIDDYRFSPLDDYLNYGILYFDEFDKLLHPISTTNDENWNNVLQSSLLTVIDGREVTIRSRVLDTKKMLVLFSGAFSEIKSHVTSVDRLGLIKREKEDDPAFRKSLKHAGLLPELISRINVITQTEKLSKSQIRDLILNSGDAIIRQFEASFLLSGEILELSDNDINFIIDRVYDSPDGVRLIKSTMFELLKEKMFALEVKT